MRAAERSVNDLPRELQQQAERAEGTWQAQVSRLGDLELRTLALEAAGKGSQQAGTKEDCVVNLRTGVFHKTRSWPARRTACGQPIKARVWEFRAALTGLNRCARPECWGHQAVVADNESDSSWSEQGNRVRLYRVQFSRAMSTHSSPWSVVSVSPTANCDAPMQGNPRSG